MTKYGLRARVLAFTIAPTFIIGALMASYFIVHRYQQLEADLIEQGISVIEPLAMASEYSLEQNSREQLKRLISLAHRQQAPFIQAVAIFNANHALFVTSNYHNDFRTLALPSDAPIPRLTHISRQDNALILHTPIFAQTHWQPHPQANTAAEPPIMGYIALRISTDHASVRHYRDSLFALLLVVGGGLLCTLCGFLLVKRVTQPISDMVHAVHKIREGRLDTRVGGQLTGELDMLKNGINAMAKALAEYHEEMQQNIDQATSDLRETLEQIEIQNVELDMAKRRAQEAARVKSEFLANMSHELRTPLNGVIGFTHQLLKSQLNEQQRDYLSTIEKSAHNLLAIINDILDFSKLEAGKLRLEQTPFSLRDTLGETLHLLGPSAHAKQLELSLHIDQQVPDLLQGDPMRLQQILTNLVGNALKFTERGNVDVLVTQTAPSPQAPPRLRVQIRDSGIGISPEQQRLLFQAFNQADSSISRRYGGTGLGLVITQKLVQQMGGQLWLESTLGQGSVFRFTLPLEQAALRPLTQLPLAAPLPHAPLWLCEADPFTHAALEAQLATWQLGVQSLDPNGPWPSMSQEALVLLGCSTQHNAERVMARCRALASASPRPARIIVLLNSHAPQQFEAMRQAGADVCLSKPVNHHKLWRALQTASAPTPPLPAHTADPHRLVTATPSAAPRPDTAAYGQVLAVDDNAANLKLLQALLAERVHAVTFCHNGQEALAAAQRQRFDLILMDLQMPIMDGVSAMHAIRAESCNQTTPIIAVTAHALAEERVALLAQGMDAYLTKPIDESQLAQLLARFIPAPALAADAAPVLMQAAAGSAPAQAASITSATAETQGEAKAALNVIAPPTAMQPSAKVAAPRYQLIDWPRALVLATGKEPLAQELLGLLCAQIPAILALLHSENLDSETLRQELHRLQGGAAYCAIPPLSRLLAQFAEAFAQGVSASDLEPECFELADLLEQVAQEAQGLLLAKVAAPA
ncbi:MAG: two-component sensor histidine kinase BarA [Aeromonas sp.]